MQDPSGVGTRPDGKPEPGGEPRGHPRLYRHIGRRYGDGRGVLPRAGPQGAGPQAVDLQGAGLQGSGLQGWGPQGSGPQNAARADLPMPAPNLELPAMPSFLTALVIAVALAFGAHAVLDTYQKPVGVAFTTSGARI